jgi:hypothetical protein
MNSSPKKLRRFRRDFEEEAAAVTVTYCKSR